jgi:ABC-type multidrug transport system fused ATPase/permease subunit
LKTKKEKPKYNVFQNTIYAFKNIWQSGQKSLAAAAAVKVPVNFILEVIALYTPKIILDRLEFSESMQVMIAVIAALLIGTMVFELVNNFVESREWSSYHKMWGYYNRNIYIKYLDADYETLENPRFRDMHQTAWQVCESYFTPAMNFPKNFPLLFTDILSFILFAGVISVLNPLILVLLCATVIINYFMLKAARDYERGVQDKRIAVFRKVHYLASMSTQFNHGKDIRLYGMGKWFRKMSEMFMGEWQGVKREIEQKNFKAALINFIIVLLRDGGAYIYLIYKAVAGGISAGEFVLYFAAIGQFAGWFSGLIDIWINIYTASLHFGYMREFFEYPNKTNRGKGIELPQQANGLDIELKNVSYKYPGADNPAVKNVNLKIAAGEKVALVGLNGAGKTTLVKLICGMYAPAEGEVLLNGHRADEYNIDEYHTLFSAVFQQFRFLPLSIAHNIAIVPKEEADMIKLERCVKLAGLKEKIDGLEQGIDTPLIKEINPGATELSGGEQQKLMLARAIYKDAPILILDEPTAALDPIAESEMYMKYSDIAKDKTSVFISHRLASTRFCDRIALVAEGEIAETGTHDELTKKGGKYAELFEIQSHYYKDGEAAAKNEDE